MEKWSECSVVFVLCVCVCEGGVLPKPVPVRDPEKQSIFNAEQQIKPDWEYTFELELSCDASRCFYYHNFGVNTLFILLSTPTDYQILLWFHHLKPNRRHPELLIFLEMNTDILSSSLRTLHSVCWEKAQTLGVSLEIYFSVLLSETYLALQGFSSITSGWFSIQVLVQSLVNLKLDSFLVGHLAHTVGILQMILQIIQNAAAC